MTTPDTPEQIAALAGRLTRAQREVLLTHRAGYDWRWYATSARAPDSWANAGSPMLKTHLLAWHPNPRETATRLTPLGLAVRRFITEQEGRV